MANVGIFTETRWIDLMKETVIQVFGLENNRTIEFFKYCEIMDFDSLCNYFYLLTGVEA